VFSGLLFISRFLMKQDQI